MTAPERRIDVDGQTFVVRDDEQGGFRVDWVSGPNPDYGFSIGPPVGYILATGPKDRASTRERATGSESREYLERSIRSFLAIVDPVTGYIPD